jgi:hypothetical protein
MDFLSEVERKLDLPPAEKAQVMRELRSHFEELRDEFAAVGMDAGTAEQEAAGRLGDPDDIASRMRAVHCRATWRTALLTALPYLNALLWAIVVSVLRFQIRSHHVAHSQASSIGQATIVFLTLLFGVITLIGTLLAFKRRSRPMWLATWMPFAIGSLLSLPLLWMPQHVPTFELLQRLRWHAPVHTLVMGAIAVYVFRRSPKWMGILAGLTIVDLGILGAVYSTVSLESHFANFTLPRLLQAPLVLAIALKVFGWHPYGSMTQASLFLFAIYATSFSRAVSRDPWAETAFLLLPPLLTIAIVLIYARAATWRHKLAALAAGLLAKGALFGVSYTIVFQGPRLGRGIGHYYYTASPILEALVLACWVVFAPMLFERRWSASKAEIVR